jgi:hypothetical protein
MSDNIEHFNKPNAEVLRHFRSKIGPKWERLFHESNIRFKLRHFPGMTEDLINSVMVTLLGAKVKCNNVVAPLIHVDGDGHPQCAICATVPVVDAMTLVPDRDPLPGDEDVSVVFFICQRHKDDPEDTMAEIEDNGIFPRLLEYRKETKIKLD